MKYIYSTIIAFIIILSHVVTINAATYAQSWVSTSTSATSAIMPNKRLAPVQANYFTATSTTATSTFMGYGEFGVESASTTLLHSSFAVAPSTPSEHAGFPSDYGMRFRVKYPITVSQLGRQFEAGDVHDHNVTVWNEYDGTAISTGNVLLASASDSNLFKWVSVTPFTLIPGVDYMISATENTVDLSHYSAYTPNLDPVFQDIWSGYGTGPGTPPYSGATIGTMRSTPAMKFVNANSIGNVSVFGTGTSETRQAFSVTNGSGNSVFNVSDDGQVKTYATTTLSAADILKDVSGVFVMEGDSMSTPLYSKGFIKTWGEQAVNAKGSGALGKLAMFNFALGGDTAFLMQTEYTTEGHLVAPLKRHQWGYFAIYAGSNDISNSDTAVNAYGYLKTIWAAARADGYKIVAFTITPRTAWTAGSAKEIQRLELNNMILSDPSLYDYIVRLDVLFPNASDTTYIYDGTHLSSAATTIIGKSIANLILKSPYMLSNAVTATSTQSSMDLLLNPGGRNIGIGTSSPYAKLSVVGEIVAPYYTATSSTASTFPYASTTALTVSGALYNSSLSDGCLNVTSGLIGSTGSACGAGGGGSGGGSWSTTTSTVSGRLINYPNNNTDVVAIGSNATTTSEFWFDPNTSKSYLSGNVGIGTTSPYATLSVVGQVVGNYFTANSITATSSFMGNVNIGTAVPNMLPNGFGSGTYQFQISSSSNDVVGMNIINTNPGSQSATGIFLSNNLTPLAVPGFAATYYGGMAFSGSNWNGPAVGLGALPVNSLAVYATDGALVLGSATTTGHVDFYTGAGSFAGGTPDMILNSSGYLGIGTSSPYAKLSVVGPVVAEYFTATSTTATSTFAGGLNIHGNTLIVDSSSNHVFIGTSTGSAPLSIGAQTNGEGLLVTGNQTGMTAFKTLARFQTASTSPVVQIGHTLTGGTMAASLGIGDDAFKGFSGEFYGGLDIAYGGAPATLLLGAENNKTTRANLTTKIFRIGGVPYNTAQNVTGVLVANNGVSSNVLSWGGGSSVVQGATQQDFYSIPTINTAGIARLSIYGNGSIGINNTTPSHQLDIKLPVDATAKILSFDTIKATNTATSTTASLDKVGLEISSSGTWNGSNSRNIGIYVSTLTGGTLNYDALFNGGNSVGIGTSTPWAKLSVSNYGGTQAQFVIASSTGTNATSTSFIVDTFGNVGIGTSTPYAKLSVVGQVVGSYFTATSTTLASSFVNSSTTLASFGYASSTEMYVRGKHILGTYDKSIVIASTTPDSNYRSFSTATSSFVIWNPKDAIGLQNLYCDTTNGTVTAEIGNGTATTTAVCTAAGLDVSSSVTWSARGNVILNLGSIGTSANSVTVTGTFYNQ